MFLDFIRMLREDYGVPISMRYVIDFIRGLRKGLAQNLDEIFLFARLCFVKRVDHMDAFERCFALYFFGVDLPAVAEGDPELLETKQFREWLRDAIARGEIKPVTHNLSSEDLMRRFWETVREQMEAHHGGNRWVGTGGTSPFGHSGSARDGIRVGGEGRYNSARAVFGDRRYVAYAGEQSLRGDNIRQALGSLKHLKPVGAPSELDLPETIYRTGRNGGEIELEMKRPERDRLKVMLLIDNGGTSMLPHVDLTRLLFAKIKDRFKSCKTYFFHNTIYDYVYSDAARTEPMAVTKLLREDRETRVLIVGDASMAPDELTGRYTPAHYSGRAHMSSYFWLMRLRERFAHSVWLNPIPRHIWIDGRYSWTLQKIREVFHMDDLSLAGIKRAVRYLNSRHTETVA